MSKLELVLSNIRVACERVGRDISDVQLVAVSKTWGVQEIQSVVDEGQIVFGENKLQELELKAPAMSDSLEWHYIGGLQRNKVRKVLQYSQWIHSVDSEKLLLAINRIAGEEGRKPRIFLQVNIDEEETKGGLLPHEVAGLVKLSYEQPHVELAGLMCIPASKVEKEDVRPAFRRMRELRDRVVQEAGVNLRYLSMGMSGDYEIAVEEGATHVRVGSALFGARSYLSH